MRKLLLATTALIALGSVAKADFVGVGDTFPINGMTVEKDGFEDNLNNGKGVTSGSGVDDAITIGISTPSTESVDLAGGNSTITPTKGDADFNSITFTPPTSAGFTSFTTRGQLSAAGDVFITVNDQLGNVFTFEEKKSGDFSPIGVEAVAGSGEIIESVTVTTDLTGGFNEIKQESFGFDVAPAAAVPEPASWAMMVLGFLGVGGIATMRKRRDRYSFRMV
jgi:hypothetical protein